MADHELTVTKSDMVQVLDVGSQNMYYVRKDCVDTGSHQLGWLPAYVIGLRNQEEAPLKYVICASRCCEFLEEKKTNIISCTCTRICVNICCCWQKIV